MGLELKRAQESLYKTTAHVPVGSADGWVELVEVDLWFRALTTNALEQLEAENADREMSFIGAKALWLSKILVRWSITENGFLVPPTFEILKTLDRHQLDALIEAINDYEFPRKRFNSTPEPEPRRLKYAENGESTAARR